MIRVTIDRDAVAQNVVIAALSALAVGLVNWGVEELKAWTKGKDRE